MIDYPQEGYLPLATAPMEWRETDKYEVLLDPVTGTRGNIGRLAIAAQVTKDVSWEPVRDKLHYAINREFNDLIIQHAQNIRQVRLESIGLEWIIDTIEPHAGPVTIGDRFADLVDYDLKHELQQRYESEREIEVVPGAEWILVGDSGCLTYHYEMPRGVSQWRTRIVHEGVVLTAVQPGTTPKDDAMLKRPAFTAPDHIQIVVDLQFFVHLLHPKRPLLIGPK